MHSIEREMAINLNYEIGFGQPKGCQYNQKYTVETWSSFSKGSILLQLLDLIEVSQVTWLTHDAAGLISQTDLVCVCHCATHEDGLQVNLFWWIICRRGRTRIDHCHIVQSLQLRKVFPSFFLLFFFHEHRTVRNDYAESSLLLWPLDISGVKCAVLQSF